MKKPSFTSLALTALLASGMALPLGAQARQTPDQGVAPRLRTESPLVRSASIPGTSCEGVYLADWWKLIWTESYGPSTGQNLAMRWPAGSSPLEMVGEFLVGPSTPGTLGVLLVGDRGPLTSTGLLVDGISQVVLTRFDATGYASVPISLASLSCVRGTGFRFAVQAMVPTSSGPLMSHGLEIHIR